MRLDRFKAKYQKYLFGALVLILCAAAAVVWQTPANSAEDQKSSAQEPMDEQPDAMAAFRTERQQLRSMQQGQLYEIAEDTDTSAELAGEAKKMILQMTEQTEQEITIEGVLKLRGYADAIATVHPDSVNVLVRTDSLSAEESAAILELVLRETGMDAENVKIIPIN